MISLVLRGETATGEILKSQRRQAGPAATRAVSRLIPVKARLVAVWRSEGIEASHFILRNGGIRPIALDPRALSVAGIVSRLIPVKARLVAVWRSEGIEASHFILRNGGIRPIALDPRALSVAGIYAVGLTSQRLMPGETTDLILVEADRGDR